MLKLRVRQDWREKAFWQVAFVPTVIRAAKIFGCSCVIAHSLMRRFKQTGVSVDAQDRPEIRKQRQD